MGILNKLKQKVESPVVEKTTKVVSPRLARTRPVIVRPRITEKTAHQSSQNKYVFDVRLDATRIEVAQAVTALYGVRPTAVHTQRRRAEPVRFGKVSGVRKAVKRAIVTLPKGKTIDAYEGR